MRRRCRARRCVAMRLTSKRATRRASARRTRGAFMRRRRANTVRAQVRARLRLRLRLRQAPPFIAAALRQPSRLARPAGL
ncbi:hypothetical protein [Burkholderia pseudomallei]|uniref:hypothetical protein n=1 Tax=Burkholderia pseudomallei TaxID=28450 RepID=UPI0009B1D8E3|nr:hypothetical protein [Burkholderia pseudomallei]